MITNTPRNVALRNPEEATNFTVTVYCGSAKTIEQRYLDFAAQVGSAIAVRGWDLCWGGEFRSMMGALANAAKAGGSRTYGVVPQSLAQRDIADPALADLLIVNTMRERKAAMETQGNAFLALPGGIGTCEELFEVWTARAIGLHIKPVVLLDVDGHYDGLLRWLNDLHERGFMPQHARDALIVTNDISTALDACQS